MTEARYRFPPSVPEAKFGAHKPLAASGLPCIPLAGLSGVTDVGIVLSPVSLPDALPIRITRTVCECSTRQLGKTGVAKQDIKPRKVNRQLSTDECVNVKARWRLRS